MSTILSRLVETINQVKLQPLTDYEKNEMKNAVLDRIGCGIAAKRLALGLEVSSFVEQTMCNGESTIWGTGMKTQAHLAALVNGATSSHLEYDSHDSMVPALIALGEQLGASGETLLQSMKNGYITGVILKKLLASSVEKRGLHWPAYIAAFISSAACSNLLGLTDAGTANAISIAATFSPAAPFESFTSGASVKDLYGGWGNMLGVQSAQLSGLGLTGPDTIFEGERGLFKNWLNGSPEVGAVESAMVTEDIKMLFHIKPFPSCTSAHPTLTALEKLMSENPGIHHDVIENVEVGTYRFGVDLSDESNTETPIGAKLNIPFLAATLLVHGQLLPEHVEEPWLRDSVVLELADKVSVSCNADDDELLTRTRTARVVVTLKTGERIEAYTGSSRWSKTRATDDEIKDKFRANVGPYFSGKRVEQIISVVGEIEHLADICLLTELLRPE